MPSFKGFDICTNELMTKQKAVFPAEGRFVECVGKPGYYEEWCTKNGYIKFKSVPSTDIYQVGDKLIMHPAMVEEFKKVMK